MLKKTIIIIMVMIVVVGSSIIIYNIFNPKITRESVITEFNKNKEHFTIVKDYLLTQDDNYYIKFKTYNEDIEDENIKKSIRYLIDKVGYERIYNESSLKNPKVDKVHVFLRGGNNNDEFGIVYYGMEDLESQITSEYLGDGWYFYWMGYY